MNNDILALNFEIILKLLKSKDNKIKMLENEIMTMIMTIHFKKP